jgi:hypothetical protein
MKRSWWMGLVLAVATSAMMLSGCGDNACDKACTKLKDCNPNATITCDTSNCSGAAETFAECINSHTCEDQGMCVVGG